MADEYSQRTESTLSWQLKPLLPGRSQTTPIGGMSEDGSRICSSEKKTIRSPPAVMLSAQGDDK